MRLSDLDENIDLDEAPMGSLSKLGNKLASYVPGEIGHKAKGRLDTGDLANQLRSEFSRYLGQSGQSPDARSIEAFLQARHLPTVKAMNTIPPGVTNLSKSQIDTIFLTAVQERQTAPGSRQSAPSANTSSGGTPPAAPVTLSAVQQSASSLSRRDKKALIAHLITQV